VPGLHGSGDEYRYRAREITCLTEDELAVADSAEVRAAYQASADACAAELELPEPLRAEIFG
jgi:hypothetical protein